ncbi:hypothetical protein ABZT43_50525 [Streptomyces sp. NPDC005349]|uniref:hypothetical protein n=1 Tax=Streptomyces sp. NPDC005349 TaxID=3157037 RepID=UPI0033BC4BAA
MPEVSEGFELGAREMLTPLASVAAFAVSPGHLVKASDRGADEMVDVELTRPDLGSFVVVIAAMTQFQYADPDVLTCAVEDPPVGGWLGLELRAALRLTRDKPGQSGQESSGALVM